MNLLDLDKTELTSLCQSLDEPKFRGSQLFDALYNGLDYTDQTNLPKSLLDKLNNAGHTMQCVKIHKKLTSKDKTIKYLFRLKDNNIIEGVVMSYKFGATLCLSTQVGCKMNCAFCASGLNGFVRNLTAGEMMGQVITANKDIGGSLKNRQITNIVLMGTGEPLDNYDNVVKFLRLLTSKDGFNFSVRNISLSTCGIVPKIEKLADTGLNINLCISLHAPNDEIRQKIMPIARRYNIESVLESCEHYHTLTNRRFIVEYVLIQGVNASTKDAQQLADLLQNKHCHVNLIRLNEVKERGLKGVSEPQTSAFLRTLCKNKISATIRRSLGDDVFGACGQLRNSEVNND